MLGPLNITTLGGGDLALVAVPLGNGPLFVVDNDAFDQIPLAVQSWSISGSDANKFAINIFTGVLTYTGPQVAGNYNVTVRVQDNQGFFDTQAITVQLFTGSNDGNPHITSLGGGNTVGIDITAGSTFVVDAEAFDSDSAPASLTWFIEDAPPGLFTINLTTGVLSFVNPPAYDPEGNNIYEVQIGVQDEDFNTDYQAIIISVVPGNTAPVATNGSNSGNEDSAIAGTLIATDGDGDPLTYAIASGPAHGSVTISGSGYTYTPNANYNGTDSFTFRANDGSLNSNDATVSLSVAAVNDALVVTAPVVLPIAEEDQGINGAPYIITSAQLLANASDADGNAGITISNLAVASGTGTITSNGNGSWTYSPVRYDDSAATFSYTVTSGTDSINTTATLDINPYDNLPVVSGPVILPAINEDSSVIITSAQLLANASDVDSPTLNIVNLNVNRGQLVSNANGTWTYTPRANDDSGVTFTYEVRDGRGFGYGAQATATLDLLPVAEASPGGAELVVNQTIPGSQSSSSHVILADGRTVITWVDSSSATVKARIYGSDGEPDTGEFVVGTALTSFRGALPDVIALSGGGFAIGWGSDAASGHSVRLYGIDGTALGAAFEPHPGVSSYSAITLLALSNGGFETAYTEAPSTGGYRSVVRGFDATGAATGAATAIGDGVGASLFTDIQLAARPDGGFIAAWDRDATSGIRPNFSIATYDAAGTAAGPSFDFGPLGNGFFYQPSLAVAVLDNGNYVATWSRERSGDQQAGIRAQIFSPTGAAIGSEFVVNTYTGSIEGDPQITSLRDGGFVVVWSTSGSSGGYDDFSASIRFQQFSANGARVDAEQLANVTTNDAQFDPSVSAAVGGGFLISWTDRSENSPSSGFNPFDVRMSYFGTDGGGGHQNHAPTVSGPIPFTLAEDGTLTLTAAQLLANASDIDVGDTLSIVNLTIGPVDQLGTSFIHLTPNADGSFTLSPEYFYPDYAGPVTLSYFVFDGTASVRTQAIGTITAVDDPTFYTIDTGIFGGIYENDSLTVRTAATGSVSVLTLDPDDATHFTLVDDAGGRFSIVDTGRVVLNALGQRIAESAGRIIINPGVTLDYETATSYTVIVRSATTNSHVVTDIPVTINILDVQETGFSRVGAETTIDFGSFVSNLGLQSEVQNVEITRLNNGNNLVIWAHRDHSFGENGLYGDGGTTRFFAQQLDPNGALVGTRLTVFESTFGFFGAGAGNLAVVPVGTSGFNVSVYEFAGLSGQSIHNYTVNNAGAITQSQIALAPGSTLLQNYGEGLDVGPDLIALQSGGFAVAYYNTGPYSPSSNPTNLFVQRYDNAGVVVGTPVAILQNFTESPVSEIKFLQTAAGGFIVSYLDGDRVQASGRQVHLLFLDSNFAATDTTAFAAPALGDEQTLDLLQLSNGQFLLTYQLAGGSSAGQIIGLNGAPSGNAFSLSSATYSGLQVEVLPDGGFVAVWESRSTLGGPPGIRAQRFNNGGTKVDAELVVSTTAASYSNGPTADGFYLSDRYITALGNHQFAVTWTQAEAPDVYRHNYYQEGSTIQRQVFSYPPLANTPPIAANASNTGTEDTPITGTLAATDADGNPLTYAVVAAPAHGTVTLSGATYTYTPGANYNGTDRFTFTANDGTATSNVATVSLNVAAVNDAPTIILDQGNVSTAEDAAYSLSFAGRFGDVDGDTLTYSGNFLPAWLSIDPATGLLSGTPSNSDVGSYDISITASDGQLSISDSFTITVTNVNDAPVVVIALANQASPEDTAVSFTLPAGTFTDVDAGDALTLSATLAGGAALPSWLSFNAVTRAFAGTPPLNFNGNLAVQVTATDSGSLAASSTFTLAITAVNDAPVVAVLIPDRTTAEDAAFSYTLPAGTFTDVDNSTLTLTASALPGWLSFNAATRTFSGTPTNANVGTVNVTVTASDGSLSVSDVFAITVTNTNDAPTVAVAILDQAATQGSAFSFTLPAGTFADVDAGDTMALTTSGVPSWLSFNAATRTFTGTPGAANVGSASITVTATDSAGAAVSDIFSITVAGSGTPPINGTNGNNILFGTNGSDVINGLGGNDILIGNGGNDTVDGGSGDDVIDGGSGDDTLLGGSGDDFLFGGNGVDLLSGGTGDDFLFGDDGNDQLSGDDGDDYLDGGDGNDKLNGGNGADVLFGWSGADTLSGGAGNDRLSGGSGADIINGGAGSDRLDGGAGNDIFVFSATSDSAVGGNRDRILDFTRGSDVIDLSAIDANTLVAGNQAFSFIGSSAFSGVAGQLRFAGGIVAGDVNGDGIADFEIQVQFSGGPPPPLTVGDFVP